MPPTSQQVAAYQRWEDEKARQFDSIKCDLAFPPDEQCFTIDNFAERDAIQVIVGVNDIDEPIFANFNLAEYIRTKALQPKARIVFENVRLTTSQAVARVHNIQGLKGQIGNIRPNYMKVMFVAEIDNGKRWITLFDASKRINKFLAERKHETRTQSNTPAPPAPPAAPAAAPAPPAAAMAAAPAPPAPAAALATGSSSRNRERERERERAREACVVCTVADNDEGTRIDPCGSWIHLECLKNLFGSFLSNNNPQIPKCPCKINTTINKEQHDILRTSKIDTYLSDEQVKLWQTVLHKRKFSNSLLRTCPKCDNVQNITNPYAKSYYCMNPSCHVEQTWGFCTTCNVEIADITHTCLTTADISSFTTYSSRNRSVVMPCPKCNNAVEKISSDQCNHMSCCICDIKYCGACSHEFKKRGNSNTYDYTHKCSSTNLYSIDNRNPILKKIAGNNLRTF